jgi:hypothetical protein
MRNSVAVPLLPLLLFLASLSPSSPANRDPSSSSLGADCPLGDSLRNAARFFPIAGLPNTLAQRRKVVQPTKARRVLTLGRAEQY